MIIKISQTASNTKQSYDVDIGDAYYRGEAGNISRYQPVTLVGKEGELKGVLNTLRAWERLFDVTKNGSSHGSFARVKNGLFSKYYSISLAEGESFKCYCISKGRFEYIPIYRGDVQIALVETFLSVEDYKYVHKLYLLDEYACFAEMLALFVIYYAGFVYAQRYHMSSGSYYGYSWSFLRYNKKYDPSWRETHFPDENFFGKLNVFK